MFGAILLKTSFSIIYSFVGAFWFDRVMDGIKDKHYLRVGFAAMLCLTNVCFLIKLIFT